MKHIKAFVLPFLFILLCMNVYAQSNMDALQNELQKEQFNVVEEILTSASEQDAPLYEEKILQAARNCV